MKIKYKLFYDLTITYIIIIKYYLNIYTVYFKYNWDI